MFKIYELSKINGRDMETVWEPATHVRIFSTFLIVTLSNFILFTNQNTLLQMAGSQMVHFLQQLCSFSKQRPSPAASSYTSWAVHNLNSAALGEKHTMADLYFSTTFRFSHLCKAQNMRERITPTGEKLRATSLSSENPKTPRNWAQHVSPFPLD